MCIFCKKKKKTQSFVREGDDWKCLSDKRWSMKVEWIGFNFTNNDSREIEKEILEPDHLVLDLGYIAY